MVANVTGWSELMQGNLFGAVFNVYDTAVSGWSVFGLFVVFQAVLYIKTRNAVLMWITGVLFAAMYATTVYIDVILNRNSIMYIFAILILELAGILYFTFFK